MVTDRDIFENQSAWLQQLRRRMLEITRRRVPVDEAEDLVQSALEVIVEKGSAFDQDPPGVAWCLQVLRNVIGNHYRREGTKKRFLDASVDPENVALPLEALDSLDRVRAIEEGLDQLENISPDCGRYLRTMLDETPVHEIARREGLETNALYQRLYRCRGKLREILRQKGVLP